MPLNLDPPYPHDAAAADAAEHRRLAHHEADVVIVGAGILGSALATTLARQGRSVILLEKSLKQPDRIVGELLQPGGCRTLEELGLSDCLEGIDAIEVDGYDIIYYGESCLVSYPKDGRGTLDGQAQGRSFHHGRFVQHLREAAMRERNVTVVETTATDLVKTDTTEQVLGVQCMTKGARDYYFGHLTVVCDGYASTFRNHEPESAQTKKRVPVSKSKFYALELEDCALPVPLHGHVILGAGAPTLLYQIGTHETRVLVDVPAGIPSASVANGGVKGHLRNVVLPDLPESVKPSFDAALQRVENPPKDGKATPLRSMPNSFLPSTANKVRGLCILGDAHNMRHPLTGGGMTVALNDVLLLSRLLSPEEVPDLSHTKSVLAALNELHWQRKNLSSVINILAQALYSLFAANDAQLRALQNGCFRYFQFGGECIAGPTGLLSGLTKRPWVLIYHFFAVALLAMWIYVLEGLPSAAKRRRASSKVSRKQDLVKTGAHPDAPMVDDHASALLHASKLDLVGAPLRLLMSPGVLYKACVVLFPYIWAELQG